MKNSSLYESVLDHPHKNLNPSLWDEDKKLRNDVKNQITSVIIKWLKKNAPGTTLKNLVLLGSNCGYNYNATSDIDVNVNTDLDKERLKSLVKLLPNGNMLNGTLHMINYYLTDDEKHEKALKNADSAYDILNDRWIIKPEKSDTQINYFYVTEIARFFMDGIDLRIKEFERDLLELRIYKKLLNDVTIDSEKSDILKNIERKRLEVKADLDAIHIAHHVLISFRHEAYNDPDKAMKFMIDISVGPNKSINNLVYKVLERFGYTEKLEKYEKIREKIGSEITERT